MYRVYLDGNIYNLFKIQRNVNYVKREFKCNKIPSEYFKKKEGF